MISLLHLEDSPRDTELIHGILADEGFTCAVTRVDTEPEFLAALTQKRFDLILADYTLPSFDGISALRIAKEKCPEVPFIFLSGTLGEEVAIEALKTGATDYVFKTRLARLVPSVQRALREAKERADLKRAEEERERLRRAQADLAYLNRVSTMGELTASLAHEIKQPISAAITDARTCLRWLNRDQPEMREAQDAASRVIKDVTRAADIIGRIGSLFKKDVLQSELVDVNTVIQEMMTLLHSEAARYSIAIRTELADDLPQVWADRVQVQQVFMNLMLNGIEAMKDIGIPGKLTIRSQQDGDGQILISITDTGVGLLAEQADQIFDAFITSKAQGTGMGLPISRSIVEAHGGSLWTIPNDGPGATFHFTLPIETGAQKTP